MFYARVRITLDNQLRQGSWTHGNPDSHLQPLLCFSYFGYAGEANNDLPCLIYDILITTTILLWQCLIFLNCLSVVMRIVQNIMIFMRLVWVYEQNVISFGLHIFNFNITNFYRFFYNHLAVHLTMYDTMLMSFHCMLHVWVWMSNYVFHSFLGTLIH